MKMDWHKLYFGHVSPAEVQEAVKDEDWQRIRKSIKGASLEMKFLTLRAYLCNEKAAGKDMRMVQVRITNYVTALSRGGLIKPEDYR